MKLAAKKNKILSAIMTCVLAITLMAGFPAVKAYAASGTVYSCVINRCYRHPITKVIEDSGGENSYATGQGMVEGCVYSNGILEVTDDGAYYLTIRMSLMDYTSGHSFQVQNVGDSGWSTPSEIGITGNGSDSNGTTADVCMRVPSENCIVRGEMYVEPMGRNVIFYLYPSDYSEGNNTDMNATMVTESSNGTAVESSGSGSVDNSGTSGNSSLGSGNSSLQSSGSSDKSSSSSKKLESSVKEAAKSNSDSSSLDTENAVNSAEGLSLSTAKDGTSDSNSDSGNTSSGNRIFQIALAVVVTGLILLGAVSGVIYFFRKNWRRWGGAEDDDEQTFEKSIGCPPCHDHDFFSGRLCRPSQGKKSSDSATQTESSTDETASSKTADKKTSDSKSDKDSSNEDAKSLLEIDDPEEKAAVEAAKKKVQAMKESPRIIATSPATADICDKLELDLVGVCSSTVSTIPDRYKDVETVGTAMSPDMEIVSSLNPDWILSPVSLQSDLQPKYEAIDTDWAFLNLRSVPGMYRSIQELGEIFDREDQAQKLVDEFTEFYDDYKKKNEGKDHPKVMILMGLPGSYIIATPNSYVGSLVELAGGENVYSDTDQEFLTVNTEDMKTKEPDIILRAAHALPDQVVEMFNKDFAENDIWQHFDAVKNGRVYDLTYEYFGMSATFKYPQALEELQPILYPESDEDSAKAKETSDNAQKKAKDSDATEKYNEQQSKQKGEDR